MANAKEIKLDVKVDLHTWDELYTKTRSLLIDPVEYPKVEPEKPISSPRAPALAVFRERVEHVNEMDTNTFPGLGPEAAAMHEAIFGPGAAKREFDMREAVERQVVQQADHIRKIAKAGSRTMMINRFKSRLLRTWGMIAAIPQTLSVIWTKPPCVVDEMLTNLTDDIPSYLQATEHVYSYPGVDWGVDRAPSRHCSPVAAFCTPSRNPITGVWSLGE